MDDKISQQFRQAMRDAGIITDSPIIADGKLHHCHVVGDARNSRNAWYIIHLDPPMCGRFGCWKRGIKGKWQASFMTPTPEYDFARAQAEKERLERQREQLEAQCAAWSTTAWKQAPPASDGHLYLLRNGLRSYGLRRQGPAHTGLLLIPLMVFTGEIEGMQFIDKDGRKWYRAGSKKSGNCYVIGTPTAEGNILIAEDYASGASLHLATGYPTVVAFEAGNLRDIAIIMRALHQKARVIVCADDDRYAKVNTGIKEATAAAAAVDALLAIPKFTRTHPSLPRPTNFNDLYLLEGARKVWECVAVAGKVP